MIREIARLWVLNTSGDVLANEITPLFRYKCKLMVWDATAEDFGMMHDSSFIISAVFGVVDVSVRDNDGIYETWNGPPVFDLIRTGHNNGGFSGGGCILEVLFQDIKLLKLLL